MKTSWQTKNFEDCLDKAVYTKKIQRKDFLESGDFPIISQEEDFINGYWNKRPDLFKVSTPVVIFGDHTQVLKYVDFDFVLGADGVKILQPKDFLNTRFFYYFLQGINLKTLGYARHYRLLKDLEIPLPPLAEQKRIVGILDEVFGKVVKAKENSEKNLKNSKELFESYLQGVFENKGKGWEEKTLDQVCIELFAGGDVPKKNFSKFKTEKYNIPIYANGFKEKGLYGYTDIKRVIKPSVTISARGTIGYSEIREEYFFPIVRLIVLTPNDSIIDLKFLHYITHNFKFSNTGTSIPQLTIPMIENIPIPLPPLSEQKEIVKKLDMLSGETKRLEAIFRTKIADLDELKRSVLEKAFKGEL